MRLTRVSAGQPLARGESAYKPDSVGDDHLSGADVSVDLDAAYPVLGGPPHRTCLALLRTGYAWPPTLPPTPVRSYRTLSPLPAPRILSDLRPLAVCSLLHFPRIAAPGGYPASCPVESGLSSTGCPAAAVRPTPS